MLGLKKTLPPLKSTVGEKMTVFGPVKFGDGLQIDGTVQGDVLPEGDAPSLLIVSESGTVQGEIRADYMIIGGTVNGNVTAGETLELNAGARVTGDVNYKTLQMQPGAVIAGRLCPQLPQQPPVAADTAQPMLEPDFGDNFSDPDAERRFF